MSNFVVYKSSAGSGKTFTLVKEYLRLALHDEKKLQWNFKRILAVTFTNKAAAEMKQRVVGALNKIVHEEPLPQPGPLLCEELNISEATLKDRARILLQAILHNYSDLAIGTIDSFTHKVVKTFAHDLELPVNFTLETDVDGFYAQVISELLSRIGDDAQITRLLKEYSLGRTEENNAWDPEKDLLEFVKLLQKENAGHFLQKLENFSSEDLDNFRITFTKFGKEYKQHLKSSADSALDLLHQNHITAPDLWGGSNSPVSFFKRCSRSEISLEDISKPNLQKVIQKNNWIKDSVPNAAQLNSQLSSFATELTDYIEKNHPHYLLTQLVRGQIYQLMLVKKIEEISRQKKEEEQIVFISEFNQRIFELINNEPTPFIYERLGERYHHYLLDEFQDTSALQWQNILPLLDNSLSNGWFNLLVGDGKQSIYRWRNADVKQFAMLPELTHVKSQAAAERANSLKRNFIGKNLDTNYRSSKTIVEFNNQLFNFLSGKHLHEPFDKIYAGQAQQIKSPSIGYITFDTGKVEKELFEDFHVSKVKTYIDAALEDGFNYGDICVITRNKADGSEAAAYLVSNGIPVVSSESLLLKNNPAVHTLVAALTYLDNPEDHVSATSVLNWLANSNRIEKSNLNFAIKALRHKDLFEILENEGILFSKRDFPLKNIFDNCVQISELLGLNELHPLYMRFFLDEVNEFLVTKNSNLSQFLQWWEIRQEKASVVLQENSNAVRIMTIHGSKGLEFPVVIIPNCNWLLYKPGNNWVDIEKKETGLPVAVIKLSDKAGQAGLQEELSGEQSEQALDNLNLLYVAFTRAVSRLHVITSVSAANHLKGIHKWIEEFLKGSLGEKNFFEIGERKPAEKHKRQQMPEIKLGALQFSQSNANIRIKASWSNAKEEEEARTAGIQLHKIMSHIECREDILPALNAAWLEGYLKQDEISVLEKKICDLMSHSLLKDYFIKNAGSKLEAELITAEGEILRPDKLFFGHNETVIIDYKTGSENKNKYEKQMFKYEQALKDMGYQNIKKIIAYVDLSEVILI